MVDTPIPENKRGGLRSSRKRAGDHDNLDGGNFEAVAIPDTRDEGKPTKPSKKPKSATKTNNTAKPSEPADRPVETEKMFPGGDRVEVEPATGPKRGRRPRKLTENPEVSQVESSKPVGKSTKSKKSEESLDLDKEGEGLNEEHDAANDKTKRRGRPRKQKAADEDSAQVPEPAKLPQPSLDEVSVRKPSKARKGKEPVSKGAATKDPKAQETGTEQPASESPASNKPTTKEPVHKKPITKEPINKETSNKNPTTKEPAHKKPITKEPTNKKAANKKSATEKPATEKSATEKSATEKSATKKPPTEKPATEKPATEKPAIEEPAPRKPVAKASRQANIGEVLKETTDVESTSSKPSRGRKPKKTITDAETSGTNQEPNLGKVAGSINETDLAGAEASEPSGNDGATIEATKSNKRKTPPSAESDPFRDVIDPLTELASTKKKQKKGVPKSLEAAKTTIGGPISPLLDTVTHGVQTAKDVVAEAVTSPPTSILEDVNTVARGAIDGNRDGLKSLEESEETLAKAGKDKGKGKGGERAEQSSKEAEPGENSGKDEELQTAEPNPGTSRQDEDKDEDDGEEEDFEEEDQTLSIVIGFDDSDEEPVLEEFKSGQEVPAAPTTSVSKSTKEDGGGPGVVYVGYVRSVPSSSYDWFFVVQKSCANHHDRRIPHGFYEHEMRAYFSQFGSITRLRLSRNRNTGASKHYAFIEFASAEVANIVASTMNSYLLFGHILRCKVVPPEQVHEKLWVGANRRFKKVPWNRIQGRQLDMPMGREGWERRVETEKKRREKRNEVLKEIGYEGPAVDLREVDDIPVREEESNQVVPALEFAESMEEVLQEDKTVMMGSSDGVLVVREEITTSKVSRSKRKGEPAELEHEHQQRRETSAATSKGSESGTRTSKRKADDVEFSAPKKARGEEDKPEAEGATVGGV